MRGEIPAGPTAFLPAVRRFHLSSSKRRKRLRPEGGRDRAATPPGKNTPPPVAALPRRIPLRLIGAGAVVFFFALSLRLAVLAELRDLPIVRTPQLDSFEYLEWARILASGDFVWPATLPHGPGYPFFLAALLVVFDSSLTAVRVAQCVAGALTCVLVFLIGRRFYGDRAGLAAGLILGAYAPLMLIDNSILGEGLLILLVVAAVWSALRSDGRIGWVVASGLLLGLAIIVRPTAVLAAPVLVAWIYRSAASPWRRVFVLVATIALPVAPVTVFNWYNAGAFIPVQARGGLNFYYGISPFRTGIADSRLGGAWEDLSNEAARHGYMGPAEDRYFVEKALAEIRAEPARLARLLAVKALWLVQNVEIRDSHSFYFFRAHSRVLKAGLPFAVLFALSVAGLVIALRRRQIAWPFLSLVLLFGASVVLLLVGSRYRMPIVPWLAVFGGFGVASFMDFAAARERREMMIAAAIALCAGGATLVRDHPPSRNLAEEWEFTGHSLLKEGHGRAAREAFELSLKENPRGVRALGGLSLVAQQEGDPERAGNLLSRAIAIDPRYTDGHFAKGRLAERRGDVRGAIESYAAVVRAQPWRPEANLKLAEALVAGGRAAQAEALYARVIELFDKSLVVTPPAERARAYLRLAELRGAAGRADAAVPAARQAVQIEPENGRGWMLLAMLLIDTKRFTEAAVALDRARMLNPDDPHLALVQRRLQYESSRADPAAGTRSARSERMPAPSEASRHDIVGARP